MEGRARGYPLLFYEFTSGRFSLSDESSVCNMDE